MPRFKDKATAGSLADSTIFPVTTDPSGTAVDEVSPWALIKSTLATWLGFTKASSSGPTSLAFYEDTDNGSNKVTVKAPASISSDADLILPGTAGNLALTNGTTALEVIGVALSDETTALTTGTAKATMRMPFAMTLTAVRASVTTAPTGGTLLTVDINEGGSTILSTKLTFDASEKTTTTAATPAVISDAVLADDAEITFDIDAVGSTIAGAGLKCFLIGYRT